MIKLTDKISEHLTVADVVRSTTATVKKIKNIPTEEELQHLKDLAEHVYEPVWVYMEGLMVITSGYRSKALNTAVKGSTTSFHCKGMGIDLMSTHPHKTNKDLFNFIKDNLNFTELGWEKYYKDQPVWVHVGYDKNRCTEKEIFTVK